MNKYLGLLFTRNPIKYLRKRGVKIGENVRVTVYPYFWDYPKIGSEPHLIEIGDNSILSYGISFVTHDAGINISKKYNDKYKDLIYYGRIKIGNNVFIGCNTTILPNISIGDNSIVGACSLVTKSIPSGEVWAGVPAKFICSIEEYSNKKLDLMKKMNGINVSELKDKYKKITSEIADSIEGSRN